MKMLTFPFNAVPNRYLEAGRRVPNRTVHSLAVTSILPADHTADTIDRYDKYIVFIIVHLSNNK